MVEHGVYVCGWKESPGGFELWVKSRPRVRSRGRTYREAEDALLEAIIAAGGAYHAVLEYVPPLPLSAFDRKYSVPELYLVCGDAAAETDEPKGTWFETAEERARRESWYDAFFVAPRCEACGHFSSTRSEERLRLIYVKGSYGGAFLYFAGAWLRLFSEDFLVLLTDEERRRLQFRPTVRGKRARKQFFELAGPSGPDYVALAGQKLKGWRCDACGLSFYSCRYSEDCDINRFVARADLPDPLPEVFTVGKQPNVSLCVTAGRWAKMVDRPGTRGIVSSLLGVAPDNEVVRTPELPPPGDA
jgi:hypothetical protein